jgi:hypothetical protein
MQRLSGGLMTRITKRITPFALLAATACASQSHPTAQTPAPQPSTPVSASIPPANPDLPRQHDFLTSLPVRDAAQFVLTALCVKLSLTAGNNVRIDIGSPNSRTIAYPENADYFSAVSELTTSAGNKIRIDCEWLADNKTRVTIQSDLSQDRFAVVQKVVANSLQETALH